MRWCFEVVCWWPAVPGTCWNGIPSAGSAPIRQGSRGHVAGPWHYTGCLWLSRLWCHQQTSERWTAAFFTMSLMKKQNIGLTAPHQKQPPGYNLLASFGSSCSFYLWHLRPTLSKALLKSMAITSVWWPAYMFSGKALTNSKSWVSQDKLHLNPCSRECCRLRLWEWALRLMQ